MNAGGCCEKGEETDYKSDVGRQAGCAGIGVLVMESLGCIANLFPAFLICCSSSYCGCCWCISIVAAGISGLVGSAFPSCGKKNAANLRIMFGTSIVSFIMRLIMVIVLGIIVHNLKTELETYDNCTKTYTTSSSSSSSSAAAYAAYFCSKYLSMGSREVQVIVLQYFTVALVFACLWEIVSIVGMVAGCVGARAEDDANKMAQPRVQQVQQVQQVRMVQPVVAQAKVVYIDDKV